MARGLRGKIGDVIEDAVVVPEAVDVRSVEQLVKKWDRSNYRRQIYHVQPVDVEHIGRQLQHGGSQLHVPQFRLVGRHLLAGFDTPPANRTPQNCYDYLHQGIITQETMH